MPRKRKNGTKKGLAALSIAILLFFLLNIGLALTTYKAFGMRVIPIEVAPPTNPTETTALTTPITYTTVYTTTYITATTATTAATIQTTTTQTQTATATQTLTSTAISTITSTITQTVTQTGTPYSLGPLYFTDIKLNTPTGGVWSKFLSLNPNYKKSNWVAVSFNRDFSDDKYVVRPLYWIQIQIFDWKNNQTKTILPWTLFHSGEGASVREWYEWDNRFGRLHYYIVEEDNLIVDWTWHCPQIQLEPTQAILISFKFNFTKPISATIQWGSMGEYMFVSSPLSSLALLESDWNFRFKIDWIFKEAEGLPLNYAFVVGLMFDEAWLKNVKILLAPGLEPPSLALLSLNLGTKILIIDEWWIIPLAIGFISLILSRKKIKNRD